MTPYHFFHIVSIETFVTLNPVLYRTVSLLPHEFPNWTNIPIFSIAQVSIPEAITCKVINGFVEWIIKIIDVVDVCCIPLFFSLAIETHWFTVTGIRIGVSERNRYSRNRELVKALYKILKTQVFLYGWYINRENTGNHPLIFSYHKRPFSCRHWHIFSDCLQILSFQIDSRTLYYSSHEHMFAYYQK